MKIQGRNCEIKVYGNNPYDHIVTDDQLQIIFKELAEERIVDIMKRYTAGEYTDDCISFAILDPTAPDQKPSDETLFATINISPDNNLVINAIAKAITQSDYHTDCGILAHTQKHRLPDGAFMFGYSVDVDGTIVGASGLEETQDRYQAYMLAVGLNNKIVDLRKKWEKDHPDDLWYCKYNKPLGRYTDVLNQKPRLTW